MPPPDMQKFLYHIIKQLDLKSVDWQAIAEGTGITNGHAARMRYSRFKRAMEGHVVVHRKKAGPSKATGRSKKLKDESDGEDDKTALKVKLENGNGNTYISPYQPAGTNHASFDGSQRSNTPSLSPNGFIKSEHSADSVNPHYTPHMPSSGSGISGQLPLPEFSPASTIGHAYALESPLLQMPVNQSGPPYSRPRLFGPPSTQSQDYVSPYEQDYQPISSEGHLMHGLMDFDFSSPNQSGSNSAYSPRMYPAPPGSQPDISNGAARRPDGWNGPPY